MKGRIIVGKEDIETFKEICVDRFNGAYKIGEDLKYSFYVDLEFSDIQDIFSLGQIFEQANILKNNNVFSKLT